MAFVWSDPTITPGGQKKGYSYTDDMDWGANTSWGNQWKQAISRGDFAFAQRLENIMRTQKNAGGGQGMQNATNAWWNNRLNTGNVPTNTQPLNLGQISVTSPSDRGYQNIQLGQKPIIAGNGSISYGQPNNTSQPNFNTNWFASAMKNQGGYQAPNLGNPVTNPNINNGSTNTNLSNIDWSNQQTNVGVNNTVPNRQWNMNSGTYSPVGY